jgi:hypothetical protein
VAVTAALAMSALVAVPAAAQEAEPTSAEPITVVGVDYAYQGLPTSLPVGTELGFANEGVELHEMIIARVSDDATESLEELLAMGDEAMASGKVEIVGQGPLIALPGGTAMGTLPLAREGRYAALCFIPTGAVPSVFEEAGVDITAMGPETDVATLPPEIQAIMGNPPHLAFGMVQEFTVTAEGTEVGPLPEPMPAEVEAEAPAASE